MPSLRFNGRNTLWWLLTFAWAAQMSVLSTSGFNSSQTKSRLVSLLVAWQIVVTPDTLDILHSVLRKLAHVATYAVLTLLLYRTVGGKWEVWQASIARRCVIAVAVYSLADEFHQLFVPDRGASLVDCGIDTIGAIIAMLMIYGYWRLAQKFALKRDADLRTSIC